jgi:hypothetical protein
VDATCRSRGTKLEEVEIGCIYNSKNGNDTWGACAEAGTGRGKRGWGKMRECGKFDFQYHNLGVKILKINTKGGKGN